MNYNMEQQSENEDLNELQNAISEYTSLVNKLKNSQTLKTYHKNYMETIKNTTQNINETQLAKMNQLIPPGIGTDHNFNLYKFLLKIPKNCALKVPVIDSLFIFSNQNHFVYLGNDKNGNIFKVKGMKSLNIFYCKLSTNESDRLPICIYKPFFGKKVLFSLAENLKKFIENYKDFDGYFQKFVQNHNDRCFIFRLH